VRCERKSTGLKFTQEQSDKVPPTRRRSALDRRRKGDFQGRRTL
jgi:hypothetical protein